jgi:hypothetical protein
MSSIRPPEDWKNHTPDTLDILLFVQQQIRQGVMPEMFFGRVDIHSLHSFVLGLHFTLYCQHQRDPRYMAFVDWLRDIKQDFPAGGGWARKFLEDCQGDHLAAIHRFLDRVAEFDALERRKP